MSANTELPHTDDHDTVSKYLYGSILFIGPVSSCLWTYHRPRQLPCPTTEPRFLLTHTRSTRCISYQLLTAPICMEPTSRCSPRVHPSTPSAAGSFSTVSGYVTERLTAPASAPALSTKGSENVAFPIDSAAICIYSPELTYFFHTFVGGAR